MDDKQLLAEVDSILEKMPPIAEFGTMSGASDAWMGMVNAVLAGRLTPREEADLQLFNHAIEKGAYITTSRPAAVRGIVRMLHKLRHGLLMSSGGTGTIVMDKGMHFEYFEAVRTQVEAATNDILFVDPYLDASVLSKFCVFAKAGVTIRLLAMKYMQTLEPAATALNQQRGGGVLLRKTDEVHDRYVFIDGAKCFLSGGSFKDGPKYASSVVTEIVDGVPQLLQIYEFAWSSAQVVL